MTNRRARPLSAGLLFLSLAALLSGCATTPADAPTSVDAPTPAPITGEQLRAEDVTETIYGTAAVAGDQGAGEWLLDDAVSLRIISLDGQPKLSVDAPCNLLTYDLATANADPLVWTITGGPAMTLVGCMDVDGEREQWLMDTLGAADVSLTQTTTMMRVQSGPITIDASASTTPVSSEATAEVPPMTDTQPSNVPAEGPLDAPTATAAPAEPLIDVQQLTNKALDQANGAGVLLSTLTAEEKKAYPIYAVRTTYGQLSSDAPGLGGDARISSDAPMWALSVHAPVANDAPYGFPAKTWDVYTVVYDAITGEVVVFSTGIDLEALGVTGDLITAD